MRSAIIDGQSDAFPTESLCKAMMVSPSGYSNWKARRHGPKPGGKRLSDDHLLTLIRGSHARSKGAYGSPRIYDELKDAGHPVGKRRVERLMRERGLATSADSRRRPVQNTDCRLHPTSWTASSCPVCPMRPGWLISPTSAQPRAGYIWRWLLICPTERSWAGQSGHV